jgi:hypothetical protein
MSKSGLKKYVATRYKAADPIAIVRFGTSKILPAKTNGELTNPTNSCVEWLGISITYLTLSM